MNDRSNAIAVTLFLLMVSVACFGQTGIGLSERRIQIEDSRIGYLNNQQRLLVNQGDLSSAWIVVAEGAERFQLFGNRVALFRTGTLWVKEEGLASAWMQIANKVDRFELLGDRLAILRSGVLEVKEGPLNASWTQVANNVDRFELSGNRLAILRSGVLEVKEGPLNAPWTQVANNVDQFELSGNRIAILRGDVLEAKQGDLKSDFVRVGGPPPELACETTCGISNTTSCSILRGVCQSGTVAKCECTCDINIGICVQFSNNCHCGPP